MDKDWNLLKDREIIDLMIGDSKIKNDIFIDYKMPYMRGIDICNFGKEIGIDVSYWDKGKLSRWMYMEKVIDNVIKEKKVSLFFKELLNLKRFRGIGEIDHYKSANELYWESINNFMVKINEILFFEKCHIEYNLETWLFVLVDDEEESIIESESIDKIDKQYIKRLKNEILNAIKNADYESCITKSRTLLEEIMIYGIEKKNELVEVKGNINKLYSQFKTLYDMHQSKNMDKRINNLLSGFEKIITSISSMRDENSDSHGVGDKRINIEKHHASLFANSAITMSDFLLSVINRKNT